MSKFSDSSPAFEEFKVLTEVLFEQSHKLDKVFAIFFDTQTQLRPSSSFYDFVSQKISDQVQKAGLLWAMILIQA